MCVCMMCVYLHVCVTFVYVCVLVCGVYMLCMHVCGTCTYTLHNHKQLITSQMLPACKQIQPKEVRKKQEKVLDKIYSQVICSLTHKRVVVRHLQW